MRLTAEVVRGAPAYMNPLNERELGLRGYKLPAIENLGVTEDQYETIDLSDNEISTLENFPLLKRLQSLLINNNRIVRIADGLGKMLPQLTNLMLTGNKLEVLGQLDPLREFKGSLVHLSLVNNPVTKQPNYRSYVIAMLPNLRTLDFQKIKEQERKAAVKHMKEMEEKQHMESEDAAPKQIRTFVPGTSLGGASEKKGITAEQRRKLLDRIKNAASLEEIEKLEQMLQGTIPFSN